METTPDQAQRERTPREQVGGGRRPTRRLSFLGLTAAAVRCSDRLCPAYRLPAQHGPDITLFTAISRPHTDTPVPTNPDRQPALQD